MTFFLDNNLSPKLAAGMSGFGEEVTHLQDHFPRDAKDPEWLPDIGQKGWYLITRDKNIRHKPAEIKALRQNRVGAFYLGGKSLKRCDLVEQLVRNWRRIKELAARTKRPFAFRVPPRGKKIVQIF